MNGRELDVIWILTHLAVDMIFIDYHCLMIINIFICVQQPLGLNLMSLYAFCVDVHYSRCLCESYPFC